MPNIYELELIMQNILLKKIEIDSLEKLKASLGENMKITDDKIKLSQEKVSIYIQMQRLNAKDVIEYNSALKIISILEIKRTTIWNQILKNETKINEIKTEIKQIEDKIIILKHKIKFREARPEPPYVCKICFVDGFMHQKDLNIHQDEVWM